MAYVFTITQAELTLVNQYSGIVASYINGNIANAKNRIGERKRLTLSVTSNSNIKFTSFYFNLGLFLPQSYVTAFLGAKPPSYWAYSFGGSYTPAMALLMNYQSPSAGFPEPGRNEIAYIIPLTDFTFQILIDFEQTYDCLDYITPNQDDNHSRYLKDTRINPIELDESLTTVYNSTTIDIRAYIYAQNTIAPGSFGFIEWNPSYGYKAGFYNKNTHGAAPYFSNPVWILERNAVTVTAFSNIQDTIVKFECDCPVPPSAMVLKIFRADKTDQTVNFITNYDLEVSEIVTGGPTVGKIKNPFVGPTFVAGTTYRWTFNIDKNLVNTGELYRMIAIVYYNNFPVNYEVNSFISDQTEVNADAPYYGAGLTFSGFMGDLLYQYTGNFLTSTIEERMFATCKFSFPANQWANDILTRLGITTTNDPKRYLTTIEFFIKSPDTFITGFTQPFGEIYDYRILNRSTRGGGIRYVGSGITLDETVPDEILMKAEWRNRYESDQLNYASLVNGVLYYPGSSNQNWATSTLLYPPHLEVVWKLTFYYDDYIVPFTDYIVFTQKLVVKDYVADTILKVSAQNPPFDTKDFWCNGEDMCLQGEIVDNVTINPADNYFLITNIDPGSGNIATIEEAEVFTPYQPTFSQLVTPKIYDQDMVYGTPTPLMGKFCVDETLLALGDYKISVIAKKS
jgi:hypothetical protein